jgi:hypothetical protein
MHRKETDYFSREAWKQHVQDKLERTKDLAHGYSELIYFEKLPCYYALFRSPFLDLLGCFGFRLVSLYYSKCVRGEPTLPPCT